MVVPAFGFSVGDFIAAIQLIDQVKKALQDAAGASKQYQEAILQLELLGDVLQRVRRLQPSSHDVAAIEKIKIYAAACHIPLAEFLTAIEKYSPHLGYQRPPQLSFAKSIVRLSRKAEWAVVVEKELASLRAKIAPYLAAINILLSTEGLEGASRTHALTQQELAVSIQALSQLQSLESTIKTDVASQSQIAALVPAFQALLERQTQASDLNLGALQQSTDSLHERLAIQESLIRSLLDSHSLVSSVPPGLRQGVKVETIGPGGSGSDDKDQQNIHRDLVSGITRTRQSTKAFHDTMLGLLQMFLHILPMLQNVYRGIVLLPRQPKLLLEDDIRLEDALGRILSLPYQHFRFWPVLHARLVCEFKDRPGEAKVSQNEFHLVNLAGNADRVLTRETWEQFVVPGAQLAMSMFYRKGKATAQTCPGCGSEFNGEKYSKWICCGVCRLTFRMIESHHLTKGKASWLKSAVRHITEAMTLDDLLDTAESSDSGSVPDQRLNNEDPKGTQRFNETRDENDAIIFFRRVHILDAPQLPMPESIHSLAQKADGSIYRSRVYDRIRMRKTFREALRRAYENGKPELAVAVGELWYLSLNNDRLLALIHAILTQKATDDEIVEFRAHVKQSKKRIKDGSSVFLAVREEKWCSGKTHSRTVLANHWPDEDTTTSSSEEEYGYTSDEQEDEDEDGYDSYDCDSEDSEVDGRGYVENSDDEQDRSGFDAANESEDGSDAYDASDSGAN